MVSIRQGRFEFDLREWAIAWAFSKVRQIAGLGTEIDLSGIREEHTIVFKSQVTYLLMPRSELVKLANQFREVCCRSLGLAYPLPLLAFFRRLHDWNFH